MNYLDRFEDGVEEGILYASIGAWDEVFISENADPWGVLGDNDRWVIWHMLIQYLYEVVTSLATWLESSHGLFSNQQLLIL